MKMLELMRDQERPPDFSSMDLILIMFTKCEPESEGKLILGTFIKIVDKEAVQSGKRSMLTQS